MLVFSQNFHLFILLQTTSKHHTVDGMGNILHRACVGRAPRAARPLVGKAARWAKTTARLRFSPRGERPRGARGMLHPRVFDWIRDAGTYNPTPTAGQ